MILMYILFEKTKRNNNQSTIPKKGTDPRKNLKMPRDSQSLGPTRPKRLRVSKHKATSRHESSRKTLYDLPPAMGRDKMKDIEMSDELIVTSPSALNEGIKETQDSSAEEETIPDKYKHIPPSSNNLR